MAEKKKPAKKRSVNKTWRIGYDEPNGRRIHVYGENTRKASFDEIVLGDWLHIEMMSEKDDCYWMRVGRGKSERVFFSYVKNGERVVRQDEGPGHD